MKIGIRSKSNTNQCIPKSNWLITHDSPNTVSRKVGLLLYHMRISNNSFTKCPRTDDQTSSEIRIIFKIVSMGCANSANAVDIFTLTLIATAKAFGPLLKISAVLWKSKEITPLKENSNANKFDLVFSY